MTTASQPLVCSIPRYGLQREVVFVYLGHTTHPISWAQDFVELVDRARRKVRSAAADLSVPLHTIGVSDDVERGLELLRQHDTWDEVSLGGATTNSILIEHIWNRPPALCTWPHVMVLLRDFEIAPGVVTVHGHQYLLRLHNPLEIRHWVDSAAELRFGL